MINFNHKKLNNYLTSFFLFFYLSLGFYIFYHLFLIQKEKQNISNQIQLEIKHNSDNIETKTNLLFDDIKQTKNKLIIESKEEIANQFNKNKKEFLDFISQKMDQYFTQNDKEELFQRLYKIIDSFKPSELFSSWWHNKK